MSCTAGMARCRPTCAHRALVDDYRAARHAQLLAEEAATSADPWMVRRRREGGVRPVVFREWLKGAANA
jgi:hypothetical protein